MENSKDHNLEKLKQQQLINEILSKNTTQNNQQVIDAYVTATTESKNQSVEDIEKKKEEILKAKAFEQKRKNRQQLEEANNLLSGMEKLVEKYSDIDGLLAEMNENSKREQEKRAEEARRIVNSLSKEKASRERLAAIERENFRRRYKSEQEKKRSMYQQIQRLEEKKKLEKSNQEIAKKEVEKREKNKQNEKKKISLLDRIKDAFFKHSQNKTISPKKPVTTTNSINRTNSRYNNLSETIIPYSNSSAKKYEKVMDIYQDRKTSPVGQNFDVSIGNNKYTSNTKSFSDAILHYSIDHGRANREAMKKVVNGEIYNPKIR